MYKYSCGFIYSASLCSTKVLYFSTLSWCNKLSHDFNWHLPNLSMELCLFSCSMNTCFIFNETSVIFLLHSGSSYSLSCILIFFYKLSQVTKSTLLISHKHLSFSCYILHLELVFCNWCEIRIYYFLPNMEATSSNTVYFIIYPYLNNKYLFCDILHFCVCVLALSSVLFISLLCVNTVMFNSYFFTLSLDF